MISQYDGAVGTIIASIATTAIVTLWQLYAVKIPQFQSSNELEIKVRLSNFSFFAFESIYEIRK